MYQRFAQWSAFCAGISLIAVFWVKDWKEKLRVVDALQGRHSEIVIYSAHWEVIIQPYFLPSLFFVLFVALWISFGRRDKFRNK